MADGEVRRSSGAGHMKVNRIPFAHSVPWQAASSAAKPPTPPTLEAHGGDRTVPSPAFPAPHGARALTAREPCERPSPKSENKPPKSGGGSVLHKSGADTGAPPPPHGVAGCEVRTAHGSQESMSHFQTKINKRGNSQKQPPAVQKNK